MNDKAKVFFCFFFFFFSFDVMITSDELRTKSRVRETNKNKKMMKKNETNITFMAKFKFNLVPRRFVNTFRNFIQNIPNTHYTHHT